MNADQVQHEQVATLRHASFLAHLLRSRGISPPRMTTRHVYDQQQQHRRRLSPSVAAAVPRALSPRRIVSPTPEDFALAPTITRASAAPSAAERAAARLAISTASGDDDVYRTPPRRIAPVSFAVAAPAPAPSPSPRAPAASRSVDMSTQATDASPAPPSPPPPPPPRALSVERGTQAAAAAERAPSANRGTQCDAPVPPRPQPVAVRVDAAVAADRRAQSAEQATQSDPEVQVPRARSIEMSPPRVDASMQHDSPPPPPPLPQQQRAASVGASVQASCASAEFGVQASRRTSESATNTAAAPPRASVDSCVATDARPAPRDASVGGCAVDVCNASSGTAPPPPLRSSAAQHDPAPRTLSTASQHEDDEALTVTVLTSNAATQSESARTVSASQQCVPLPVVSAHTQCEPETVVATASQGQQCTPPPTAESHTQVPAIVVGDRATQAVVVVATAAAETQAIDAEKAAMAEHLAALKQALAEAEAALQVLQAAEDDRARAAADAHERIAAERATMRADRALLSGENERAAERIALLEELLGAAHRSLLLTQRTCQIVEQESAARAALDREAAGALCAAALQCALLAMTPPPRRDAAVTAVTASSSVAVETLAAAPLAAVSVQTEAARRADVAVGTVAVALCHSSAQHVANPGVQIAVQTAPLPVAHAACETVALPARPMLQSAETQSDPVVVVDSAAEAPRALPSSCDAAVQAVATSSVGAAQTDAVRVSALVTTAVAAAQTIDEKVGTRDFAQQHAEELVPQPSAACVVAVAESATQTEVANAAVAVSTTETETETAATATAETETETVAPSQADFAQQRSPSVAEQHVQAVAATAAHEQQFDAPIAASAPPPQRLRGEFATQTVHVAVDTEEAAAESLALLQRFAAESALLRRETQRRGALVEAALLSRLDDAVLPFFASLPHVPAAAPASLEVDYDLLRRAFVVENLVQREAAARTAMLHEVLDEPLWRIAVLAPVAVPAAAEMPPSSAQEEQAVLRHLVIEKAFQLRELQLRGTVERGEWEARLDLHVAPPVTRAARSLLLSPVPTHHAAAQTDGNDEQEEQAQVDEDDRQQQQQVSADHQQQQLDVNAQEDDRSAELLLLQRGFIAERLFCAELEQRAQVAADESLSRDAVVAARLSALELELHARDNTVAQLEQRCASLLAAANASMGASHAELVRRQEALLAEHAAAQRALQQRLDAAGAELQRVRTASNAAHAESHAHQHQLAAAAATLRQRVVDLEQRLAGGEAERRALLQGAADREQEQRRALDAARREQQRLQSELRERTGERDVMLDALERWKAEQEAAAEEHAAAIAERDDRVLALESELDRLLHVTLQPVEEHVDGNQQQQQQQQLEERLAAAKSASESAASELARQREEVAALRATLQQLHDGVAVQQGGCDDLHSKHLRALEQTIANLRHVAAMQATEIAALEAEARLRREAERAAVEQLAEMQHALEAERAAHAEQLRLAAAAAAATTATAPPEPLQDAVPLAEATARFEQERRELESQLSLLRLEILQLRRAAALDSQPSASRTASAVALATAETGDDEEDGSERSAEGEEDEADDRDEADSPREAIPGLDWQTWLWYQRCRVAGEHLDE